MIDGIFSDGSVLGVFRGRNQWFEGLGEVGVAQEGGGDCCQVWPLHYCWGLNFLCRPH